MHEPLTETAQLMSKLPGLVTTKEIRSEHFPDYSETAFPVRLNQLRRSGQLESERDYYEVGARVYYTKRGIRRIVQILANPGKPGPKPKTKTQPEANGTTSTKRATGKNGATPTTKKAAAKRPKKK